ncbi:MAG: TraR/DksA C4-type zinc finger protein [Pseudomonadales bacterium]|jgi:DnaK suppressor protein|nr:TraR/DksA C4-type zinc finger protein [Pseudomonadales bacterium]MDP6471496.1 TraR/DksA C4-type zinc finger protein [Pseudomonadales bacterium]MDP6829255.1 TraR/DksA C4-type zinc finger protein [Pseudomonadales bacterium]MDP6970621.1 TraR/DksA C4-type zinc finger protein [Pseudomonadales bacterium]|tara:strand:+ start:307 stop:615 length:309 start_codon:yes stop_codon:yes gene_type:complete
MKAELEQMAAVGETAAEVVKLDQTRVGRLSRMDAIQAQAMAQATTARRLSQLRNIAQALQRIDKGQYGYCETCGEEIDPRRLEIDPTTQCCITCASSRCHSP